MQDRSSGEARWGAEELVSVLAGGDGNAMALGPKLHGEEERGNRYSRYRVK